MASQYGNIIVSLAFTLIAWILVYISFFQFHLIESQYLQSLRPDSFTSKGWFAAENLQIKAVIIGFYGLCVAFPLGISSRALILNFFFLLNLRHLPVIPLPNVIRERMQRTTDFYIFVTFSWFVGVTLFGILFFNNLDLGSATFIGALSLIGVLTFLTPQFLYRIFLLHSLHMSSQWILKSLYKRFNIELVERDNPEYMSYNIGVKLTEMKDLSGFIAATSLTQHWVYDPSHILLLIAGQGLAIGGVFIKDLIIKLN